ncbi:MAG: hypothetical protein CM15mP102_21160 [Flavobacteriales bacterium]|nr:MAG: hypothetical protein CM15mP102_21160 [Flavobacteriales bacterium]
MKKNFCFSSNHYSNYFNINFNIIKIPSFNIIENQLTNFIGFIGKPEIALLVGLIISIGFIKRDDSKNISKWIGNALKNSLDILLITGARWSIRIYNKGIRSN